METFKSTRPIYYAIKSENRTGTAYISGKLLRTSAVGSCVTIIDENLGKVQIIWSDFREFGKVTETPIERIEATELMEKVKSGEYEILTDFFDSNCVEVQVDIDDKKVKVFKMLNPTAETRMYFFKY